MNCHSCLEVLTEIARNQMIEAGARERALTHAGQCGSCAAHLGTQQHLTSDLRRLGSMIKDEAPSAAVWANLNATFDQRPPHRLPRNNYRRVYAAGAIAAVLLMAFALASFLYSRHEPISVQVSNPINAPSAAIVHTSEVPKDEVLLRADKRRLLVRHRRAVTPGRVEPEVSQPKEVATDFIPLTYVDTEVGPGAQMVRVELPRSTMAGFGLPVNVDRPDQRVKADVLLGADGLARAIRFVQ